MSICFVSKCNSPLIYTAIHAGHTVRDELISLYTIPEKDRLREEDPYTDLFAETNTAHIIGNRSRFEVDLNRPREKAVYIKPEDAWGLNVWKKEPDQKTIETSLSEYDFFYNEVRKVIDSCLEKHSRLIVLDIHSYNHHRKGSEAPFDDPESNPDINLGTGTMKNREQWQKTIDTCIDYLHSFNFQGKNLDVRENIKFRGGYFPRWIHENYPDSVCCLSIEFKKFFMDEWTGKPDKTRLNIILEMLENLGPVLIESLI